MIYDDVVRAILPTSSEIETTLNNFLIDFRDKNYHLDFKQDDLENLIENQHFFMKIHTTDSYEININDPVIFDNLLYKVFSEIKRNSIFDLLNNYFSDSYSFLCVLFVKMVEYVKCVEKLKRYHGY